MLEVGYGYALFPLVGRQLLEQIHRHQVLQQLGYIVELRVVLGIANSVYIRGQLDGLLDFTLVVAAEKLGQLLVIVKYDVGVAITARHYVRPQCAHEKHLIGEFGRGAVFGGARLLYPVGEMAHKVKEEVRLGHADHLVGYFYEETEALGGFESQAVRYALAEVFGARTRVHLERFVVVVRKVDLVEDLCGLVLDGLHFHLMWRIFALTVSFLFC